MIPAIEDRSKLATWEVEAARNWLLTVKPGASKLYHTGNLVADRETDPTAHMLGLLMKWAKDHSIVLLVQQRDTPQDRNYLAYRTAVSCSVVPTVEELSTFELEI